MTGLLISLPMSPPEGSSLVNINSEISADGVEITF